MNWATHGAILLVRNTRLLQAGGGSSCCIRVRHAMSDDYVQQSDGGAKNDAPSCGCGAGFLCVIGYVL